MRGKHFPILFFLSLSGFFNSLAQDSTYVFLVAEISPQYPDGNRAMMDFVKKELVYPKYARKAGIEGTTYVGFNVQIDGTLTDIKTIRGFHPDCSEEAERVIGLMPKWIPGRKKFDDGVTRPVVVKFVLPIIFKL